tara:strand:+ start:780 stop:1016 length:237 start_codon:yes stop_codon:yes gene_type:complete
MLLKLRILATSIATSALLLLVLCIGSQNINNRSKINLGLTSIAPLPTGFLVGISIVLGVLSGGSTAAILAKSKVSDNY